jgi:hypothetical protein
MLHSNDNNNDKNNNKNNVKIIIRRRIKIRTRMIMKIRISTPKETKMSPQVNTKYDLTNGEQKMSP